MQVKKILIMTMIALCAGLLLAGLGNAVQAAGTPAGELSIQGANVPQPLAAPALRPSRRISIPFGFADFLPIRAGGQELLVRGHGSCTLGETVTVAVTVTHDATGRMALGTLSNETCAGEADLQNWQLPVTATGDPMPTGAAESCGFAQTFDNGYVTDDYAWCKDVRLGDYLFLPITVR